jgi:hypothetical protein
MTKWNPLMMRCIRAVAGVGLAMMTLATVQPQAAVEAAGQSGNGNCGRCGGGLTSMTLRYDGTRADARIVVYQKERSTTHTLFEGVVQPGEEFTVEGANARGTLEPVIHIHVNGRMDTPIPTSCEGIFGAGLRRGSFEVTAAESAEGGKVCLDDPDGEGEGEGEEEEGCCEGQVDALVLRYNGDKADARVRILQRDGSRDVVVFNEVVQPGGEIEIEGENRNGTFGSVIRIFVDGALNARIHTSCSEPIGPGLVKGDFEVVSGTSRVGGELCPIEEGGGSSDCGDCEGQVTALTLKYNGDEAAQVRITQRDRSRQVPVFRGEVQPGGEISFHGVARQGTFGSVLQVYVAGRLNTRIHTSCSEPIGPGLVRGDFEVVAGSSRHGGKLCPVETAPPAP